MSSGFGFCGDVPGSGSEVSWSDGNSETNSRLRLYALISQDLASSIPSETPVNIQNTHPTPETCALAPKNPN